MQAESGHLLHGLIRQESMRKPHEGLAIQPLYSDNHGTKFPCNTLFENPCYAQPDNRH